MTKRMKKIRFLKEVATYRRSMEVLQIRVYRKNDAYAIFPRCHSCIDREYINYCNKCGQKMSWNSYYENVVHFTIHDDETKIKTIY